jgi:hypothetical protein
MNCSGQPSHQQSVQLPTQQIHPPINQPLSQQANLQAAKPARKMFFTLLFVELLLVSFYWIDILLGSPVAVLHALVDLDGEGNLPAWFSSFQLAFISLSLWFLVFQHHKPDKPSRSFFALPASVFLLWSADETAQMHERLTAWIGLRYVDWLPYFLNEHKALVVLLLVAVLAIVWLLRGDCLAFWQAHRRASLIAIFGFCVVFLGGAVLETIGYKFFLNGTTPLLYQTEVCFEEFFEMFGATLILYSTSLLALSKAQQPEQTQTNALLQPLLTESNLTV